MWVFFFFLSHNKKQFYYENKIYIDREKQHRWSRFAIYLKIVIVICTRVGELTKNRASGRNVKTKVDEMICASFTDIIRNGQIKNSRRLNGENFGAILPF